MLAAVAVVVLVCELAARESTSALPMLPAAAVALIGFLAAWREQGRLRLPMLLGLSLAFQVAWILLHLPRSLEPRFGGSLSAVGTSFSRRYPEAQYPPGAVLLFAFEAWLGGGPTRISTPSS